MKEANAKMDKAINSGMAFVSGNKTEYAKKADAAEKKFMGKTFRDFLYEEK